MFFPERPEGRVVEVCLCARGLAVGADGDDDVDAPVEVEVGEGGLAHTLAPVGVGARVGGVFHRLLPVKEEVVLVLV